MKKHDMESAAPGCRNSAHEERRLKLQGGHNFRDLGGFIGHGGKRTATGKLYRADDLKSLTAADLDTLSAIPLLTIVDFRSDKEAAAGPDLVPQSVKDCLHYPIQPGSLSRELFMNAYTQEKCRQLMCRIYEELAGDEACVSQYRKFFALLQSPEKLPLLFHCSAGKDRTGVAAALFLLALGVDEREVFEDYLESNRNLAGKYPDGEVFRVRPEYLQIALRKIRDYPGGLEAYLTEVLQVDLCKLHEMYLE